MQEGIILIGSDISRFSRGTDSAPKKYPVICRLARVVSNERVIHNRAQENCEVVNLK